MPVAARERGKADAGLPRVFSVTQPCRPRQAMARWADLRKLSKASDADDLADRSLFS